MILLMVADPPVTPSSRPLPVLERSLVRTIVTCDTEQKMLPFDLHTAQEHGQGTNPFSLPHWEGSQCVKQAGAASEAQQGGENNPIWLFPFSHAILLCWMLEDQMFLNSSKQI